MCRRFKINENKVKLCINVQKHYIIGKGGDVATNSVSMDCIQVYLYSYSVKLKVYSNLRR